LKCVNGNPYGIIVTGDFSVNSIENTEITDIRVDSAAVDGIVLQVAPHTRMTRVSVTRSGSDGIAVFGSVGVRLFECEMDDNRGFGYREQAFRRTGQTGDAFNCVGSKLLSCKAFRNGAGGFAFYESWHPYIDRSDIEVSGYNPADTENNLAVRGISFESVLNGVIHAPYDERSGYAIVIDVAPRLMAPNFPHGSNMITLGSIAGQQVAGQTPTSVYIIGSDANVIGPGRYGGNVVITAGSDGTILLPGCEILGALQDQGTGTRDLR
jgi:hypothetical protein